MEDYKKFMGSRLERAFITAKSFLEEDLSRKEAADILGKSRTWTYGAYEAVREALEEDLNQIEDKGRRRVIREVQEWFEKENPDLIIIDISLPKIEKLQLIEKLKKREKERKIPIIVYSRSGTSNHKEKAIEWEVTDFISGISMPLKQMVLKVKTHLGKEKSYYFNYPMESKEAVKEMAEDLSENYKCSNCGKKKTLNLIRDLSSGEKSFQVAFICFDCSVD